MVDCTANDSATSKGGKEKGGKGKDKGKGKGKNKGKMQKGKLFELEGEEIVPSPVEEESSVWILEVDTKAVSFDKAVVDTVAALHVFPLADVKARFREEALRRDGRVRLTAAGGHEVENHWKYHVALLHWSGSG